MRPYYMLASCIISWLTYTPAGHILRTPCQDNGNFSVIKHGHALAGHTMMLLKGLTIEECEMACIQRQACKSINTKSLKCKLVSKSTENPFDNVQLTAKPNWTYRTTDYSEQNIGKLCQSKKPCLSTMTCIDTCSCPGYKCIETTFGNFKDCKDAYDRGYSANKVYPIMNENANNNVTMVPCDMSTDGGGWIVFQRRVSGSVDFNVGWKAYKEGFGDPNGNFWLGLENLHRLAAPGKGAILRIDMKHTNEGNKVYHEKYSKFEVHNEASGYKLTVDGASGDAKDSLKYHNAMKFTTFDNDQDGSSNGNCAIYHSGGWWYNNCISSNLNGRFSTSTSYHKDMTWFGIKGTYGLITFSEMKLKALA